MTLRQLTSIAAALALGLGVRTGHPGLVILSVLSPVLFMRQRNRRGAWLCTMAYYFGAISALPQAVTGFFGPGDARAIGLYVVAVSLLCLPWLLIWGTNYLFLRSITGVLLGVIPPLGLIGWASPLMATGWLFPGLTVFLGVPLLFVLIAITAEAVESVPYRFVYLALVVLSLDCNLLYFARGGRASNAWEGVTLHAQANRDAVTQYAAVLSMQKRAAASTADVIVFPEGAEENWSEVTEFAWSETFRALRKKHQVALIGATSLEAGTRYRNGFVIRGAETDRFQQRIPVPLAMWHPFSQSSGVPLRLFAPGSVRVSGESVGVLMCYEMTIPWPAIATLSEHPNRLIGLANDWWAIEDPSVPHSQFTALKGWARLAGIPSTIAINLPAGMTL